jgi:formylglycine-generating enzyme required for sulfatase activity
MKTILCAVALIGAFLVLDGVSFGKGASCPPDMVQAGSVCVDKYEASVWEVDPANTKLIQKIKSGAATEAGLIAGGAVQRGVQTDNYPCSDNGNDCNQIFAVSIAGVAPSASITWFQAQQACANSGKRLLTNAEWQLAAAGTPDPGTDNGTTDCKINSIDFPGDTGSRSACVSRHGAFDMVGNAEEWVADWVPLSGGCGSAMFSNDRNCLSGTSQPGGTAAITRGGSETSGTQAGVFALNALVQPHQSSNTLGFRCGR